MIRQAVLTLVIILFPLFCLFVCFILFCFEQPKQDRQLDMVLIFRCGLLPQPGLCLHSEAVLYWGDLFMLAQYSARGKSLFNASIRRIFSKYHFYYITLLTEKLTVVLCPSPQGHVVHPFLRPRKGVTSSLPPPLLPPWDSSGWKPSLLLLQDWKFKPQVPSGSFPSPSSPLGLLTWVKQGTYGLNNSRHVITYYLTLFLNTFKGIFKMVTFIKHQDQIINAFCIIQDACPVLGI